MARTINVKLILGLRHSGMSMNDIARGNHISKHSVCIVCRIAESLGNHRRTDLKPQQRGPVPEILSRQEDVTLTVRIRS